LLTCVASGKTPGTGYGQLQVAGPITLNGSLSLVVTNGYVPATNDSFTVLTAQARSGDFSAFYYPSNAFTMELQESASAVTVDVTGVITSSTPPPAPQMSAVVSGSNLILSWTAAVNVVYRVEFSPELGTDQWTALPGDIASPGGIASKIDTLSSSNRFYRVRILR
jgi:hypothetical protein